MKKFLVIRNFFFIFQLKYFLISIHHAGIHLKLKRTFMSLLFFDHFQVTFNDFPVPVIKIDLLPHSLPKAPISVLVKKSLQKKHKLRFHCLFLQIVNI